MMPSEIWKRSNFPDRINHITKEARKVKINGVRDFLFPFKVDGLSFDWACPSEFEFPLFRSRNPLHSLLFKWFLRFIDRSQPNMAIFSSSCGSTCGPL